MGKEKEHRRHAHHPTAIGEQDKEPQGQASSIKETWHPLAESKPEDPTQSEKRVIARQDSHVSRSEKHKDIQDLERRMAQVKHLWHACILWMPRYSCSMAHIMQGPRRARMFGCSSTLAVLQLVWESDMVACMHAQAALEEAPGADNGEGLEKPEDFVGELAEKEMQHAKKIPYYLAEDDAK